ncbi:alpha-methylacyl-CoA racemase-like [Mytilus californianus]|uniref:alpha-methylacyl-CoA racemase-like n=1 Tax=Mytilus californianus TaxID=6549 RepID=UPI00224651A7|nr:alpha-methylacyl-CoA racemase-like [Mytilus californianus]
MALKGIRVIEFGGLAPVPFCGMILSDFGANVIRVDRTKSFADTDCMGRGKKSIAIDLKQEEGLNIVHKMCSKADVLIEPFRPGVMERLGLGADRLLADNPRLVYAKINGFGQKGPLANKAGHDINYISMSGLLSYLGKKGEPPLQPVNLLADFAGGGLTCALGIVMALYERSISGKGQVVDNSMVEGSAYVGSWLSNSQKIPYIWGRERGDNTLDGGRAFYGVYETKDKKYISVGALEPQFFKELIKGLGLEHIEQTDDPEEMKKLFKDVFLTKSRDEWVYQFQNLDACVSPVLEPKEAAEHLHNVDNKTFLQDESGSYEPGPAPRLSRTPGVDKVLPQPVIGQQTLMIMREMGYSDSVIEKLLQSGVIEQNSKDSKL